MNIKEANATMVLEAVILVLTVPLTESLTHSKHVYIGVPVCNIHMLVTGG